MLGVVCGSYSASRGPFPECKGAWCPACYSVAAKHDVFPIKRAMDPDREGIVDEKEGGGEGWRAIVMQDSGSGKGRVRS